MKMIYVALLLIIPFTAPGEIYSSDIIDFAVKYPAREDLPISRMNDGDTVSSLKKALKGVEWVRDGVVRDVIITEEWRTQRNEFTGITKSRYLKASVLFLRNSDSEYIYVIPCTFIQNLEYLGLVKGEIYYRMSHRYEIYRIKNK